MQKQSLILFWNTAIRYPFRTFMGLFGAAFAAVLVGFIGPLFISQLLERLQSGTFRLDDAWPLIAAYGAVQVYGEVFAWRLNMYFIWTMETAGQRDLYQKIFTALTNQSLAFHANRFGGALVSQTTKLIGSFERFWDTVFFQFIPSVSSIIAAIVILSFVFWQYAVVLGIISIVFVSAVIIGSRFMVVRVREESQANTSANAYVADAVTNITTIKSHGHEDRELTRLTAKADFWRGKSLKTMNGVLVVTTVYSSLMALINICALVAAIWAAEHNIISIGIVYLSLVYSLTVARQLWEFNSIMRNYYRIVGDAHDMTEILLLKPDVIDHSTHSLEVTNGNILFDNVTFTHEGGGTLFDNFSLHIKPGQRVGLVGHSGSGKTTFARLLLRFADVQEGQITIDGSDITNFTQDSLHKNIAYVPQEPMLFHRTLSENISYGKLNATKEDIRQAAKSANALEFIESLPNGFDTLVGERGIKLSGGQRQRVAIARAILKDAPILVLDEATSALDSESEKLIQDSLTKLMDGRTSIVVAHRLSTIAKLDRIIVLDNGKIIEDGSHAELLKKKGTYARLWSHQSGGFIEE